MFTGLFYTFYSKIHKPHVRAGDHARMYPHARMRKFCDFTVESVERSCKLSRGADFRLYSKIKTTVECCRITVERCVV